MAVRVGYAVGRGTGMELADIFERVITQLSTLCSVPVELHRSPRVYHSYFSLLDKYGDPKTMEEETLQDALHYEDFCRAQAALGTGVIFKTAFNAQSLYLVRQHLQAVKVECFNQENKSLLLVRDQSQGFYTGSNEHSVSGDSVSRTCQFSKTIFERVIVYSMDRARELWQNVAPDSIDMVYKFHLFGGVFSTWAEEWSSKYGVKINFVQPDTANRNLLAFGIRDHQLIIAGNEWADIMHVILLNMFGQGAQEVRCTENIYLQPDLQGLREYQTVHGSADEIAGRGIVNPSATLRVVAAILERHTGCKGIEDAMNGTLLTLERRNAVTPDQGGSLSSGEVVNLALDMLTNAMALSDAHKGQQFLADRVANDEGHPPPGQKRGHPSD